VPIESQLSANPLLEQVGVIGAGLPAPVAVVVLSEAAQMLPPEDVEKSLEAILVETNKSLESHERLSNMLIVDDEWTTENDLLTPTLKVKREQLEARYLATVSRKFDSKIAWEKGLDA
jgi:long-subunit acyl-CoA synthetase (AMP-forming)